MPSTKHLENDLGRRQAAQAALLFPGIDPAEIVDVNGSDIGATEHYITITLYRPVTAAQHTTVNRGSFLVATEESVKDWTPGHAAEYRRQFDSRPPTSSLAPALPAHPDQVDLWMVEHEIRSGK